MAKPHVRLIAPMGTPLSLGTYTEGAMKHLYLVGLEVPGTPQDLENQDFMGTWRPCCSLSWGPLLPLLPSHQVLQGLSEARP